MRDRRPACTILVAALVHACAWQAALAIDGLTGTEAATQQPLFVIGVPAPLLDGVHRAIVERFGLAALSGSVRADDAHALDDATGKGVRTVVALGRDACAVMMTVRPDQRTLCALLYADAFDALDCDGGCKHVEAIVMDQPPERQARVATRLFPALERFGVLRETEDGFRIAEEDLRLRGAGDLLGVKQAGLPRMKVADLEVHGDLLAVARDDAKLIVNRDEALETPRGQALRVLLYLMERDESVRYLSSA